MQTQFKVKNRKMCLHETCFLFEPSNLENNSEKNISWLIHAQKKAKTQSCAVKQSYDAKLNHIVINLCSEKRQQDTQACITRVIPGSSSSVFFQWLMGQEFRSLTVDAFFFILFLFPITMKNRTCSICAKNPYNINSYFEKIVFQTRLHPFFVTLHIQT